jgi:PAS domain S-box-containing protein
MLNAEALIGPVERSQHEVLVVDDNPPSRYATVRLLRSAGFRTREAATGAEALRQADESVSAMVLDVHLPDIDGFEVCRLLRLRSGTARLPVLHLSAAYITDEDKVRGLDSGADAYLTHPAEPAVLVATVQALVRARVAEHAMRRSESKFRAIYAKAPSGICLLDAEGRFIDANPALLALLKRDLGGVVGQRLVDFASEAWVERIGLHTAQRAWRGEFPLLDALGNLIYIDWNVSPLGDSHSDAGAHGHVSMAVATDVSERVSIERARLELLQREQAARLEAERVGRLKDDMLAVLSHELRTPLSAMLGWVYVLQRQSPTPDALRGLKAIERSGKAQSRLIADIVDVSSINLGKLRLQLEITDPAELLKGSLDVMRAAVADKGLRLRSTAVGPFLLVHADPDRFHQIVYNLLTNAIKFSKPEGVIEVSLVQSAAGVRLSVADDGEGIHPAFLPHLFDRFSQGDADNKQYRGGLGLGLSIVKHLVELHGGHVTASSPGLGLGARFDIDLPCVHEADVAMPGDAGLDDLPPKLLAGLSVLIVDDDVDACAMLQIILAERGALVHQAHSCDGALQALATCRADVLVSDIGMPGKDGLDLIRAVRQAEGTAHRLPAIALTAFARSQDEAQALAAGFDVHCAKPLRPLALIRLIAGLAPCGVQ